MSYSYLVVGIHNDGDLTTHNCATVDIARDKLQWLVDLGAKPRVFYCPTGAQQLSFNLVVALAEVKEIS